MGVTSRVFRTAPTDYSVLFAFFRGFNVDAAKALHLLYPSYSATQMTPLSALQGKPLDVHKMQCCTDRLFTKLSKADEIHVLKM